MSTTTCPGCGEKKDRRADLCAKCRKDAIQLGSAVLKNVATPSQPFKARTEHQNRVYHGRIREIALLEQPQAVRGDLWTLERELKKWAVARMAHTLNRPLHSSTEMSELEFEQMNEWLADVIDAGGRRKH